VVGGSSKEDNILLSTTYSLLTTTHFMKFLGIDFGLTHLGFAISNGDIAESLKLDTTYKTDEDLFKKVINVIRLHEVENIVIGLSDGPIGEKAKYFGSKLESLVGIHVFFQNEDFSTQKAVSQMIESGRKRSDRQTMDHNVAAANILQEYLDENKVKA
jgi:putative transcription antitermination factor YqgF